MQPVIPFEPARGESVPAGEKWIHQIKWDGVRLLAYNDGKGTELYNRKRRERTGHYPELADGSFCRAASFITDGEVIALGPDGKPSFHEVMRRDGIRNMERVNEMRKAVPVMYMIFDLLYADGAWLTELPLADRQRIMEDLIVPGEHVRLAASYPDGEALFDAVRRQNMEGIVCKDLSGAYAIGGKDGRWVKVKHYGDVTAVIGGFTQRGGVVGSLLAGLYDGAGKLRFIGKAGMGKLSAAERRALTEVLKSVLTGVCPFAGRHPEMKDAHFVLPLLTAKIRYSEWRRREGRTLRQAVIQGFVDASPEECLLEDD